MKTSITNKININDSLELEYTKPIPEHILTDEILDIFILGYRDAINSRLDNKCYRRVESLVFFEEYVYMEGYRIGCCDFKIGFCKDGAAVFDEDYKKTIKMSLMVSDFDDALSVMSSWLEQLRKLNK